MVTDRRPPSRVTDGLAFDRKILELEHRIETLKAVSQEDSIDISSELKSLEERLHREQKEIFDHLTPWQHVQLARHAARPRTLDLIELMMTDFVELHGDRRFGDDRAVVAGLARLDGRPVIVVGHQKGSDTKERIERNFGMPRPEGYRKALRVMKLAEKFGRPVISLVDTPAADPGAGSEERGQAEAIAYNLREMARLRVPIVVEVIGEGGSGGALAIGVVDIVLMLEYAVYTVCPPEACAAILWKDSTKADVAAGAMGITVDELYKLKIIDKIVKEPFGGAHRNHEKMAATLKQEIVGALDELSRLSPEELVERRHEKFRRMGAFAESGQL